MYIRDITGRTHFRKMSSLFALRKRQGAQTWAAHRVGFCSGRHHLALRGLGWVGGQAQVEEEKGADYPWSHPCRVHQPSVQMHAAPMQPSPELSRGGAEAHPSLAF